MPQPTPLLRAARPLPQHCHSAANPESLPFARDKPWLAPLAGYSDLPFRMLCRERGACVCVTEMLSAKGLVYGSPGSYELLAAHPSDTPLVVQLFGAEAEFFPPAVEMLREAGYGWFDLNMGCAVRKVMRQGAGAALLDDTDTMAAVAKALLAAAGRGRVGFKLRLAPTLTDIALRLEDMGAGWLSLHPRTAGQGFGGQANREATAKLASRLSLPLLASGDLFTAEDGLRCLDETGATGVMYARGALRNPAIFSAHHALCRGQSPQTVDAADLHSMIRRHMELACMFSANGRVLKKMRSVIPHYARSLPGVRVLREALCRCTSRQELEDALAAFFTKDERIS